MRICVAGAPELRKSTFISDFIKKWPMYKSGSESYQAHLTGTFKKGKRSNKKLQKELLDLQVESIRKHGKSDNVIFDGSPLDNFAHTLWLMGNEKGSVDDDYMAEALSKIKTSMSFIDVIFFIPITKNARDVVREDTTFSYEIDNLLKAVKYDWLANAQSKIFDVNDRPVVIDVFGEPDERIAIADLYITETGDPYGDVSIITDEDLKIAESLKAIKPKQ